MGWNTSTRSSRGTWNIQPREYNSIIIIFYHNYYCVVVVTYCWYGNVEFQHATIVVRID